MRAVEGAAPQGAPPEAALMQMILGSLVSQAVYVAAKLSVADLLAEGPRTADELAEATGAHAPSLYRVMRALASCGVFAERADGRFELTPSAELLRSDARNSLRDSAVFMGEEWHWRVWGHTLHSVMVGRPGVGAHARRGGLPLLRREPRPRRHLRPRHDEHVARRRRGGRRGLRLLRRREG